MNFPHSSQLFILLFIIFQTQLFSDDVNITGKVTNLQNEPVAGVILYLKNNNLIDTTDFNGNYTLSNITDIKNITQTINPVPPSLRGNVLSVSISKPQQSIAVQVYTCSGKLITNLKHTFTKTGLHNFSIFNNSTPGHGVYLVKIHVDGRVSHFKTVLYDRKTIVVKPSKAAPEVSPHRKTTTRKSANAVDSILVTATGYYPEIVPVGNLIMTLNIEINAIEGSPTLKLLGPNPYYLNIGDEFYEPGATAYDSIDGDLTNDIHADKTSDDINSIIEGEQFISYTVSNSSGKITMRQRCIIVQDSEGSDYTKPKIQLTGDNPLYLSINETYKEPGATATDNVDGNITSKMTIYDSLINTSTPDTHKVWYAVLDKAGNVAYAVRAVIVLNSSDITPPVIMLSGPNPVNLPVGYSYTEYGATAMDDGDLTDKIVIDDSDVDTTQVGSYRVKYTVSDNAGNIAVKRRTVNVIQIMNDTTSPNLVIKGDNPMTIKLHESYIEPGATATDDFDGDITSKIIITGSVDTSNVGTYIITYTVSDMAGNTAKATRTVYIVEQFGPKQESGLIYLGNQ